MIAEKCRLSSLFSPLVYFFGPQGLQCLPESALAMSSGDAKKKKETKLGLAHSKQASFGDWYSEVVVESEMISYYDVSGKPSVVVLSEDMPLAFSGNVPNFFSKTEKSEKNATLPGCGQQHYLRRCPYVCA